MSPQLNQARGVGPATVPADHRLPTTVRPTRYEPHLEVGLAADTFEGRVTIDVVIEDRCSRIELHADGLEAQAIELATDEATIEPELREQPDDRWILDLPRTLEPGEATLSITYEGEIGDDMTGLYRSEAGEERCLVTQCEPSDARSVFPCFDEPTFKAEIAWRIRADEDQQVLANGSLAETREHEDGTATRVFDATPPIASYLAAMAVGDFEASDPVDHHGVPFRVWALTDAEELGQRARDQAARLTSWFEAYFEQPYPYATYDQLAVPSFSFGAMENVGLVVFRKPLLLLDREMSTWDEEKALDRVVAHELAHMWFGNLVTMAWWDDLWLNEAFAEWIAHEALDQLEPGHEIWHAFRQRTDQALATDALDSTHAIYHPVQTPAEAMEMFDAITYGKGSAVMRMLEAYLGPETFRQGLASYIETFAEDNARGSQLWDHLAQASDEPVTEIMRAWVTQPGHPCVAMRLVDEGVVELTQRHHRARRTTTLQAATWPVPVVLRWADRAGVHETSVLLEGESTEIELDPAGEIAWLVGNADQGGFYRVDHGPELGQRLRANVRELSPAERWGLIRDSFSLVKAGRRSMDDHLRLVDETATGQAHFAFVDDLVGHVRELERMLETHGDAEALAGFRSWVMAAFGSALEELGTHAKPGEKPARRHRRGTVLMALAGIGGDEATLDPVLEQAETERSDPEEIDPEQAQVAVRVAARHGDHGTFETFRETYLARRDTGDPPQQVEGYLHSLPLFREDESLEALLGMVADGEIPQQSIGPLLETMLTQPHAQGAALDHVEAHAQDLLETTGPAWIARIVEAIGHVGGDRRQQARAFLEGEIGEIAPESTERALERLDQSEELAEAGVAEELAAWAREHA
ncbi:hypothetical protein BRD56_06160 [Thermoplasmatales archaeon SW_10_69_26]|nr:MAG: hypothetical protein BRD56_06160 [Thermoplasmatales archaeon SW_10_69_26]